MNAPRTCVSVAVLISVLLAATPASRASVGQALDLSELVAASDEIGVVLALSASSRRDGGRIVTDTVIEFEDHLKGSGSQRVTITTLGGSIDGFGMRVEGAGRLPVGERSLVFARGGHGGVSGLRPVGMSQGILPMRNEHGVDMVHPGGRGMALMRRVGAGRLAAAPAALMAPRPWDELREEIRDLVAQGAR